jgi:MoaA/NifB/PqqE/SkfB family radical SAM enzyme
MMRIHLILLLVKTYIFNRHVTFKKLYNLFFILMNHYFFKTKTVSAFPIKLVIDPTDNCNLNCPLCPTGMNRKGRARGFMDIEKYKIIINENYNYLFGIDLYNWGEPLLHKEIFEMASYAQEKNISVTISSNLNYLTDDMAEKAVMSGLDKLIVSIDGASGAAYSQYKRGGQLHTVLDNARKIINYKNLHNSKRPVMVWQFLVFRHNEHEIEQAGQMAQETGFNKFIVKYMRSDMGRELYISDKEKISESIKWLPSNDSLSRYDYNKERKKFRPKNCLFLWTHGVINWDGSVSPCCAVYDESKDFGNAFDEESFMKVWNNHRFQAAREQVKNKIMHDDSVCSYCLKNGFIEY